VKSRNSSQRSETLLVMFVRPGKKFGSAAENLQRRRRPDLLRQTVPDRCSSRWKGAIPVVIDRPSIAYPVQRDWFFNRLSYSNSKPCMSLCRFVLWIHSACQRWICLPSCILRRIHQHFQSFNSQWFSTYSLQFVCGIFISEFVGFYFFVLQFLLHFTLATCLTVC